MKSPFSSNTSEQRPAAGREHARACPERPQAAGLVSLKTSDTRKSVEIDQEKARFSRLKRSVLAAAKLFEIAFRGIAFRPAMLTLTYKDVDGFEPRHISELLKRVRQ